LSSDHAAHPARSTLFRKMVARDPKEPHRAATPLELLFDLCFVVGIAQAAAQLHHAIAGAHVAHGLIGFLTAFFAIWWAWMNLTWFASAFDVDDVPYRLLVLGQIAGVLVLAAGVPRAFEAGDFGVITVGYAIVRIPMIALWIRAARSDPSSRATALRYAIGVGSCQVGWLALLLLPESLRGWGFVVFALAELSVPLWAERKGATAWHPHHIAERYGLLTLIVLGESVLSATQAVQAALEFEPNVLGLLSISAGGLLILFSSWWIYFEQPAHHALHSNRESFIWGYGHFAIFASIAATGAGIAAAADHTTGRAAISREGAGAGVAIPVAIYLTSVWLTHVRPHALGRGPAFAFVLAIAGVLVTPFLPATVLIVGMVLTALVTYLVLHGRA
jgi:low temperature requirement protein LtrA